MSQTCSKTCLQRRDTRGQTAGRAEITLYSAMAPKPRDTSSTEQKRLRQRAQNAWNTVSAKQEPSSERNNCGRPGDHAKRVEVTDPHKNIQTSTNR